MSLTHWFKDITSQKIFVLVKTFWRGLEDVFHLRLQDVLIKMNIFTWLTRSHKTSWSRPVYLSWSYVFKTSSIRFQDGFKTSSRRLRVQDVLKTYYQVKLFLVTEFQDIFESYSKRFWDVLLRCLSTGGLSRSHFWEIYGQCTKFPKVVIVSQVLVFHFTTSFSGCL